MQPPFKKNQKPIPLVLYFQPHSGNKIGIEREFVERIVRSVYQSVYDIEDPNKKSYFKRIIEGLK